MSSDSKDPLLFAGKPHLISGLSDIAASFSHVLLDIFGVLHEGDNAFPEAASCLEELQKNKKHVTLFSNAPRTKESIQNHLRLRGIPPNLYQNILSSGQQVDTYFEQNQEPYASLGPFFYAIGSPDHDLLKRTSLTPVSVMSEASFILLTGPKSGLPTPESYAELWEEALALALPVVCANPDPYVILNGCRVLCAGDIAFMYEKMGGLVLWHGKPYAPFYDMAFSQLKVPKNNILAIGDSMWTDIHGASVSGLSSVLVTHTGVHRSSFVEKDLTQALQTFLDSFDDRPTYALDHLRW